MAKARILMEAMPYLQEYRGKTVVIKYGGSAMDDEILRQSFAGDVTLLSTVGIRPVIVHGGGPQITKALRRTGVETAWIDGLRVTDEETLEVVQSILAGIVNPDIVRLLTGHEAKAVGVTGIDGRMLSVRAKNERLGLVGEIEHVNPGVLEDMLDAGFIPVVAPLGRSEKDGRVYNVNADTAAGAIAAALGAEKLVYLTDVEGVYRNYENQEGLLQRLTLAELKEVIDSGTVGGGMLPKLASCVGAMEAGVHRAHILDGRIQHALLLEIFTPEGIGTMIHRFGDV
ncbi:MAG TPA: acetylglutamate kinase [Actinobacteria bacterium]|nr:acetylglutamate kinase [Actinomycetota bacterium]HDL48716.1 acetylglutamate kinase [Actinomycetota bacterium]